MKIRSEFLNILEDVDWMDDKTKKSAVDKAGSMATHIAYPQELLDNEKLKEFYSEVTSQKKITNLFPILVKLAK